jgi:hypothetical protein
MKTALPAIILILISVSLYGQNENPYSVFGYEAPVMLDKTETVDKLLLINNDSTSSVWMLAVDPSARMITIFERNKVALQYDTLTNYTMMRWLSPDPYGQFSSPYLGMGNKPHMGIDPDGGLFGLSQGWSMLAGAGIGFAVGAGAAVLTGNEDDWWKWGAVGAVAGGLVGYATGDQIVQHGSRNARSATGGKIHDNRTYSKFEPLKQQKFRGTLQKEFYLDLGSDFSGMSGKTVRFAKEVFRFNEKYTKEVRFKINSPNSIFSLDRNGQEIFSNQSNRSILETPDYRNRGETYQPAVTHEFPVYDDESVIGLRRTVSITRRVKGLYLSRIHGSGWNIVR